MWKKLPVKERMELMKTYKKGGYSYGGMVKDYNDSFESYKQAGPVAESLPENNDGMTGMMKSKIATESHYGNPAAQRMVSPNPNRYDFGDGETGTHLMGSYGNEARPSIQEVNGEMKLYDNPPRNSRENIKFDREQDARYFAENYKDVAPMMRTYGNGGKIGEEPKTEPDRSTATDYYASDVTDFNNRTQLYNDSLIVSHAPLGSERYANLPGYPDRIKSTDFAKEDNRPLNNEEERMRRLADDANRRIRGITGNNVRSVEETISTVDDEGFFMGSYPMARMPRPTQRVHYPTRPDPKIEADRIAREAKDKEAERKAAVKKEYSDRFNTGNYKYTTTSPNGQKYYFVNGESISKDLYYNKHKKTKGVER